MGVAIEANEFRIARPTAESSNGKNDAKVAPTLSSLSGIPLTPEIACRYSRELFNERARWTTRELTAEVVHRHRRAGGADAKQTIKNVINKALGVLKKNGFIQKNAYGHWERNQTPDAGDSVETALPNVLSQNKIRVERTIGEGPQFVYVYYYENDKKVANNEGRSIWECKTGKSTGDPVDRILNQSKTARHTLPIIALVIRCDDAQGTEKLLHDLFRYAGVWKKNHGCGDEWFVTSPERVAACCSEIEKLVKTLTD